MDTFIYTDSKMDFGSSAIRHAWYNEDTKELVVEFRHGNSLAGYKDVESVLWRMLIDEQSFSAGNLYVNKIKGRHKGFPIPSDATFVSKSKFTFAPQEAAKSDTLGVFKVTADVEASFSLDVPAESLEDAISRFRAQVADGLKGQEFRINLKGVTS